MLTSGGDGAGPDDMDASGTDRASCSCAGHTAGSGHFSGTDSNEESVAGWISSPELPADDGGG